MRSDRRYFVYILSSRTRVLYIGVTNNLMRRVLEHKKNVNVGFTSKYHVHQLVYYEEYNDVRIAISREKELKGWLRKKKIALIESMNPEWSDLSDGWYDQETLEGHVSKPGM